MVEHRRFELLTPTLPVLCATNCANAPSTKTIILLSCVFVNLKIQIQENFYADAPTLEKYADQIGHSRFCSFFSSFTAGQAERDEPKVPAFLLFEGEKKKPESQALRFVVVEHRRFELLTPTLPVLCATNCANAPSTSHIISQSVGIVNPNFSFFAYFRKILRATPGRASRP